ncbi:nuclear transport factor 2 family protein [Leadbetterella sp. DM7]|uniref:nuclear transport factor 2 family protein n=1 Tax=Leadbetterella sp. DM7 TaxID=3235085 RepID=UPI00349E7D1E
MKSKEVVIAFYEAMKARDYKTMASLYTINAVFSDPVFPSLSGFEAGKMWEMLLKSAKDMSVEYKVLDHGKESARVRWTALYTFSKTGRKVRNEVVSTFEILDGQIMTQRDRFNFGAWSRQALGFLPWLLGFTGITRKKVQESAERSLNDFIRGKN